MTAALVGFAALMLLILLRLPIAFAMALVGFAGFWFLEGLQISAANATVVIQTATTNYELAVVPMFILMGNLVAKAGLSKELYDASNAFLGHRRGGLAMATIVACGGFSAVSGSSLATAATMSRVAIPSMLRHGYSQSLATGSVASGGTLGILIPPSVILVIYGIMTESNIGQLFAAGILPGVAGILLYLVAIFAVVALDPRAAPNTARSSWRMRLRSLRNVWGVILLFALVMGGIYFGVFTPTEAAGVGAAGAFLFALLRRLLTWRTLFECLLESARTSAIMFAILIGALIFSNFVNVAGMPQALAGAISESGLAPMAIILVIVLVYLILGCVFDTIGMILLTVPIFYPIVSGAGFDLIWFGILVVVVTEIGLITPPIGMNVYMIKSMVPEVPAGTIFRGVLPFIGADIARLALILFLPGVVLWLPKLMTL
ncbi:MAG: TRAP transporter large permease [Bauldia litoralis]